MKLANACAPKRNHRGNGLHRVAGWGTVQQFGVWPRFRCTSAPAWILSSLTSTSGVRRFFCRNQRPIYCISATNFNLQGMDEWVANFRSICYVD